MAFHIDRDISNILSACEQMIGDTSQHDQILDRLENTQLLVNELRACRYSLLRFNAILHERRVNILRKRIMDKRMEKRKSFIHRDHFIFVFTLAAAVAVTMCMQYGYLYGDAQRSK